MRFFRETSVLPTTVFVGLSASDSCVVLGMKIEGFLTNVDCLITGDLKVEPSVGFFTKLAVVLLVVLGDDVDVVIVFVVRVVLTNLPIFGSLSPEPFFGQATPNF